MGVYKHSKDLSEELNTHLDGQKKRFPNGEFKENIKDYKKDYPNKIFDEKQVIKKASACYSAMIEAIQIEKFSKGDLGICSFENLDDKEKSMASIFLKELPNRVQALLDDIIDLDKAIKTL